MDVNLVVAGAVVGAKEEGLWQGGDQFGVPGPGDRDAGEGHVGCYGAIERAGDAFLQKIGAVGRGWNEKVGDC